MASNTSMRKGRVSVIVNICLAPFFSRSMGAKMWGLPVSARRRLARFFSITGAKVSGRKNMISIERPANAKPM